jgi:hypothetical protein
MNTLACHCGYTAKGTTPGLVAKHFRAHSCQRHIAKRERAERARAKFDAVDRTPKPCQHKKAKHQHGTHLAYKRDDCRCLPCLRAAIKAANMLELRKMNGHPLRIPAADVRRHLQHLIAQGMTVRDIARRAGVAHFTLHRLLHGRRVEDVGPVVPMQTVRAKTARALMSVEPRPSRDRHGEPAIGSTRRLQALVAQGWSLPLLATETGLSPINLRRIANSDAMHVTDRVREQITDAYDRLWNRTPDTSTAHGLGSYTKSRNMAKARGWAPPLAWDDDTINDPKARPQGIHHEPVGKHQAQLIKRAAFIENVTELLDAGLTEPAILARLRINRDAFERRCYRAGRGDLIARSRPDNKHAREAS